mmetsp:Transcript_20613/g.37248  ORF Transcript_20613/g.37248 Transcript_20613/m.37248 type:complete len:124 (+) Transcript_20613:178-549(+)|eukprot:CAMPEP_0201870456 /NCGR_PEP_ID=MMETSP0902-20130614/3541_1 /ASSEMBLY_ACC=CAM_ASM_000551 /TAXON_ID=420261 /ORGANISM="Thalassiosira antarctica, Strain CCMP982" /LENGTH=123 /DNA_ID=CAMNT_0048396059 /DNA_START=17 /DNA_END=388 /DNA_ORIENTATION=+
MIQRLVSTLLCLAAAVEVSAFSTTHNPLSVQTKRLSPMLRSSAESVVDTSEDTDDVTCFVVNDEEIITEGEKPHVVCTSEPDDYAWFNGVDPKAMREADGEETGAEECVEGESFMGKPEWECE